MNENKYDFIVVGGGILGMSTAWQLQIKHPGKTVLVLDKETSAAEHQTGHNSGVIHAGVYYKPGSLKAKFCKQGNISTKKFCHLHGIEYDECGKLLVATDAKEHERMLALVDRCAENGIDIEVWDQQQLEEREPNITGVGAIFVPSTGIVNYKKIAAKMGEIVNEKGGNVLFNTQVNRIYETTEEVKVTANDNEFSGRFLVACAGLQSDRMVEMIGLTPNFKIIPFKGEYFLLDKKHNRIVNCLIYPIPDPDLPFLGVHLTKMIDGSVAVGPNAVIAFKREGYKKMDFSLKDFLETFTFPGFIKIVFKHFKFSMVELKNSLWKPGYLKMVQKYCPSLVLDDLKFYSSGIRAQAVSRDGEIIDDFLFMNTKRCLIVCNAPSPAATSAIPIGAHIVEELEKLAQNQLLSTKAGNF